MRVPVDRIPDDGLAVFIGQGDCWARDAVAQAGEGAVSELVADLQITRIAELLRVAGTAGARITRPCDRCGGTIEIDLSGTVELLYQPALSGAVEDQHISDPSELDRGFFDGKALDLADVLMEQFALWLPERVRCGDECVHQVGPVWTCTMPASGDGPDLASQSPFAKLRLSE